MFLLVSSSDLQLHIGENEKEQMYLKVIINALNCQFPQILVAQLLHISQIQRNLLWLHVVLVSFLVLVALLCHYDTPLETITINNVYSWIIF